MGRYRNEYYQVSPILDEDNNRRIYTSLLDPNIVRNDEDIYVITTVGDRLDQLAFKYYFNPSLWWLIAAANPELRRDSVYLDVGIQLRIPSVNNPGSLLYLTQDYNKIR